MPADRHDEAERSALETELCRLCERGEYERAATRAIEGYGPELLGYLHAMAPTTADAEDLYADLCERMWTHLPGFRWQSSFRTWAYTVARNLLRSDLRVRRARKVISLSTSAEEKLAEQIRTTTALHLKSASKSRLEQVRQSLEPDDRTLLILRVDRKLPWQEVARVFADEEISSPQELTRVTASLRKRFERLKDKLRREMNVGHREA